MPFNPPVRNQAFTCYITLADALDSRSHRTNPTIAAGDFQVSKDGGALVNLTTLPVVEPSGGPLVKVALSATEMDADNVTIVGIDQTADKEWCDFALNVITTG